MIKTIIAFLFLCAIFYGGYVYLGNVPKQKIFKLIKSIIIAIIIALLGFFTLYFISKQ